MKAKKIQQQINMPIPDIPDPDYHRICRRCGKWFEPHEVDAVLPEVTGPLGALRRLRYSVSSDTSRQQYQCKRCTRIRRITQRVIWGVFFLLVVIVLLLERTGLL